MKSVNGMLLVALAMFVLWIGVTGRFPKLMEAIGIVRGKPQTTPVPDASTKPVASTSNGSGSGSGYASDELAMNMATGTKLFYNPLTWPILAGLGGVKLAGEALKQ